MKFFSKQFIKCKCECAVWHRLEGGSGASLPKRTNAARLHNVLKCMKNASKRSFPVVSFVSDGPLKIFDLKPFLDDIERHRRQFGEETGARPADERLCRGHLITRCYFLVKKEKMHKEGTQKPTHKDRLANGLIKTKLKRRVWHNADERRPEASVHAREAFIGENLATGVQNGRVDLMLLSRKARAEQIERVHRDGGGCPRQSTAQQRN